MRAVSEELLKNPRIVGGYQPDGEFPWMASLFNPRSTAEGIHRHFCGGSLVTSDVVLTAVSLKFSLPLSGVETVVHLTVCVLNILLLANC